MKNDRMLAWIAALAGPASWLIAFVGLLVIGVFVSGGPDGGWVMMDMGYKALGVIVLVHLAGIFATLAVWIWRRTRGARAGPPVIMGLVYYGLLLGFLLILEGPRELLNDSALMAASLFRR